MSGRVVKIALLADVHANSEALSACLEHARGQEPDRYVFLGDLVGYGPDPESVLETIEAAVARGGIAVLGNHDLAVARGASARMHEEARRAIEWTRSRLGAGHLQFLAGLPVAVEENGCLYVHANAWAPAEWEYIDGEVDAARSMRATLCRRTFCGHVHTPALYHMAEAGRAVHFAPTPGTRIPLGSRRCWLGIVGSVGQPRDGNPAACYALLEEPPAFLTFFRVPYDYETAARRMRQAGLPPGLSARLSKGI